MARYLHAQLVFSATLLLNGVRFFSSKEAVTSAASFSACESIAFGARCSPYEVYGRQIGLQKQYMICEGLNLRKDPFAHTPRSIS